MKYNDFKFDTAYKVVSGENDNFSAGYIFWIDSARGWFNLAYPFSGWLYPDEIDDTFFDGVEIGEAKEYIVITLVNGRTTLLHESMIKNRDNIRLW